MAVLEVIQNSYISDEMNEQAMAKPSMAGTITIGCFVGSADGVTGCTTRLQHGDSIDGPFSPVTGCSVSVGAGSNDQALVTMDAADLKAYVNPQMYGASEAYGGAGTIVIVHD